MKIFEDVEGETSSTRVFEACIVATAIIVSFISVFTGKDLGSNVADMLQFITTFIVGSCEAKKGFEYYTKMKEIKEQKDIDGDGKIG